MQSGENGPLVSVLMASYNHEKYVAEAVQSVLDQSLADLELIVVDDGSTDGTVSVIKRFGDPRIRLVELGHNHGIAVAKTWALSMAGGKYVAILNSDDAFLPKKLEKQVRLLEETPELGAVFSAVEMVNENGKPVDPYSHPQSILFNPTNRSRTEWLHQFFCHGNCLCAPTCVMPRERLLEVGYLDKRLRQLGDLDLWVRLCFEYPIFIHPEKLTRYRVRDRAGNASAPTPETSRRIRWEESRVLERYRRIATADELLAIFPEAARYTDSLSQLDSRDIAYVLARLALDQGGPRRGLFALNTLFQLLGDIDTADRIQTRFGFGYPELIDLTGTLDIIIATPPSWRARLRRRTRRMSRRGRPQPFRAS